MNAIVGATSIMAAAVARATPAEQPTDMERASKHAALCVQSPDWLRANLRAFHVDLRDEILAIAALAVEGDPRKAGEYIQAIAALRAALHDIAYEGADVEVQS